MTPCLYDASLLRERHEALERFALAWDRHHVAQVDSDYPERNRQQAEMADAYEEASVLKARSCSGTFEALRLLFDFDLGQTVELFRPVIEEIIRPEIEAIAAALRGGGR
jgi:hypothetical protein